MRIRHSLDSPPILGDCVTVCLILISLSSRIRLITLLIVWGWQQVTFAALHVHSDKIKKILPYSHLFMSWSKLDEISVKWASALPTLVAVIVLISKVIMVENCRSSKCSQAKEHFTWQKTLSFHLFLFWLAQTPKTLKIFEIDHFKVVLDYKDHSFDTL